MLFCFKLHICPRVRPPSPAHTASRHNYLFFLFVQNLFLSFYLQYLALRLLLSANIVSVGGALAVLTLLCRHACVCVCALREAKTNELFAASFRVLKNLCARQMYLALLCCVVAIVAKKMCWFKAPIESSECWIYSHILCMISVGEIIWEYKYIKLL